VQRHNKNDEAAAVVTDKKDVFYDLVRSGKSDASIKTRSHGMKISQVLRHSAVRPGQGVFIEQEN
jgi:hypothetical protein